MALDLDALRNIMYDTSPARDFLIQFPLSLDMAVVVSMALVFVTAGTLVFNRQE